MRGRSVAITLFLSLASAGTTGAETSPGHTIGLVVTSWYTALRETPDGKDECPDGLAVGTQEIYIQSLPPAERDRLNAATHHGKIDIDDPMVPVSELRRKALERGPHGQDVCWNPESVDDPPMRTVKGKMSYGLNLDGTTDGHATPGTCGHQKFTGVDGQPGIDNQWYRLMGCTYGWRSSGYMEVNPNGDLRDGGHALLIEIAGVRDLADSPDVTVTISRAADLLPKDSAGKIVPFNSFRTMGDYRYEAHGRIENGVLTTDPIDARLPFYGNLTHAEYYLRAMRLRLTIAADGNGAKGLVAGYYDFDSLWNYISKLGYAAVAGQFDCPAIYRAAQALADGFPDPKTGRCTALSSAFNIEAIPAFVIHTDTRKTALK
jgi:hypothetical protein